ncbi:protein F37C4.5-like [Hydractinia symbiolongicarpus]|uniref:protein F37C4.5-like n=1 Tax=Hydractinia symbiolongicarpus TaxID=13093 RepID=UPI00254A5AC8|nr:protein F37C4.5-like [Hydractinia symbiolongicarpus]XP_057307604.1 protein F37C4.5-like [Hydractinia symbiolongicarpus]
MDSASKYEVDVTTCCIQNVTVFMDRAEINRKLTVIAVSGTNEVLVQNLPSVIDKDSIRVTCFGKATIVEVAYKEKYIPVKVETEEELKIKEHEYVKIENSIKFLNSKKTHLLGRIHVAEKEKCLLERYRECISTNKNDTIANVLEEKNVKNLMDFLAIYKDRREKIIDTILPFKEELDAICGDIDVLKLDLYKLKAPQASEWKTTRCVSILLDVKEKGSVTLVVSYVVSNASWKPLYDVRAYNKDNTVQILYFANIKQNTGEDWEDAKLSLSTAMPSVGGSPPELQPQLLKIKQPVILVKRVKRKPKKPKTPPTPQYTSDEEKGVRRRCRRIVSSDDEEEVIESLYPEATLSESITSTNFEITRLATIQSDDVAHKVSIAQLDFSSELEYLTRPKAVTHAFLKIKAKNESRHSMLAGNANVFLDNNFITKSSLPSVSPMEEFEVALGADPAVKVTYNPLKKFEQKTGMISKAHVYNFHQQIEIKNTKSSPIKITIQDQCPKSNNEMIKVTLQEPDIKLINKKPTNEPEVIKNGNATLYTSDYKIEWVCDIAASETKKIDLRYQVEHPAGTVLA